MLAFIVFGKMLEISGATQFLNDVALGWMGNRRGGPAKVAVVASGTLADRLARLYRGLEVVVATHMPDEVAVEETFVNRNPVSTL